MTSISPSERLLAEVEGPIGWIVFNNPERRNAVSMDMWEALPFIVDAYENDPSVRVIVVRGAGTKSFIAGADISQFEKARSSPELVAEFDRIAGSARARLRATRKPTIAMIYGYCIGGGVGLALECDLRIASEGAKFGVPAAKLGLGYNVEGIHRLMEVVGPAYAKEIFFTARQFTAAEALGMGMLNRVLPEAELEPYVRDYCARIAENAPLTIEAAKIAIEELSRIPPQIDQQRCDDAVARCFESRDYVEGRRAFMEKRKPVFLGR